MRNAIFRDDSNDTVASIDTTPEQRVSTFSDASKFSQASTRAAQNDSHRQASVPSAVVRNRFRGPRHQDLEPSRRVSCGCRSRVTSPPFGGLLPRRAICISFRVVRIRCASSELYVCASTFGASGIDGKVLGSRGANKVNRYDHGHLSGVYALSLHPTPDVLVTSGRDASARVWDMRTKAQIHVLSGHTGTVADVKSQDYPQVITGSLGPTARWVKAIS
jgi:pleiotropic regulator 1